LELVETRYGPALDLRELGANKVLAIFARAEPRDFIDLAELTKRFPLEELIGLATEQDPAWTLQCSMSSRIGPALSLKPTSSQTRAPTKDCLHRKRLADPDSPTARTAPTNDRSPSDRDTDMGIDR
jgi:hypothetical protein